MNEVLGTVEKNFFGVAKTAKSVHANKLRKKSFGIEKKCIFFQDSERTLFRYFWRKSLAELSHLQSMYPWVFFRKIIFLLRIFLSFLEFERKKILVKCVKSAFYVHRWRNLRESISEKKWFLYLFRTLKKKDQTFTRKVWPELRKGFYVSRLTLTEQYFWRNLLKTSRFLGYKWSFRNSGEKNFFSGLPKLQ